MNSPVDCNTLVVSDIHLGSKVCRGEKFLSLLKSAKFKTLVINGDLFDSNRIEKLEKADWQILSSLTDVAQDRRVILVEGNHGRRLDNLAKKMGLELRDEYFFKVGRSQFLCLHGHEFDIFVKHLPRTTSAMTKIYYAIQELGGKKQRASMFLKKMSKKILRISHRQEKLARKVGTEREASVVICSHTHLPHASTVDDIAFLNSGSFCSNPCNYITISNSGRVELKEM